MRDRAGSLALLAVLAGCASAPPPAGAQRLETLALLLRAEDARLFNQPLFARAAVSGDPGVREKAALAAGRLRDPRATPLLESLLRDAVPAVRRAAAFASGVSGDRRLVKALDPVLEDSDAVTAANAADALGKLGGADATSALLAALDRPAPVVAAAALALWRVEDPSVVRRLSAFTLGAEAPADARRAAVYALARRPKKEGLPALRAVLRKDEREEDPDALAWAARAAGLLGDRDAVPDLARHAASPKLSVAVQSLQALERILSASPAGEAGAPVRDAALKRANDPLPGVAVAALRLLGRLSGEGGARETLEENLRRKGWRGQTALVSLTRLDLPGSPERAAERLAKAIASDSLELKLGACEAIELVSDDAAEEIGGRLLSDASARVRATALSVLSKRKGPPSEARLLAALRDPSPSVRAAALEAGAPLVDGPAGALLPAWLEAFGRSFAAAEPDDVVTALEAAASRGEKGRPLVEARVGDPDAVVRETARRVMVGRYGASPGGFARIPVESGRTMDDYRALARKADGFAAEVEFETARGSFVVDLDFGEAPVTASNFHALASRGFFDGLPIHRVVPDFVVQTGDPRGDGTGGPGWALRDELNPLRYVRGAVGMALSGPDTGGSQWFVALSPQPHLDGGYTVFGRVSSGMEVLDRIEQDDRLLAVRVRKPEGRRAPSAGDGP